MTTALIQLCTLYDTVSRALRGPCPGGGGLRDGQRLQLEQEAYWRACGRPDAEKLISLLVGIAQYVSEVIQADMPVMVPRKAPGTQSAQVDRDDDALRLGRAVQRSIGAHVARGVGESTQEVLTELRRLLAEHPPTAVPPSSKWLSTKEIAARLSLDEVTVARLCKKGLILADKTTSRTWRTTEDRLRRSPYLNGQSRKSRSRGNGQLE